MRLTLLACALSLVAAPCLAAATDAASYGMELEGFDYPFPVKHHAFSSQGEAMRMAYLDVMPAEPNGHTVVLLHGKNFCAATWESAIRALTQAGYRVIAPDQIGFCKSTKPAHYQYSFQQLASNTNALLESLGIERVSIVGHSMGGMLATRFALMYPQRTAQLVLVNPIGLEDWKALGVPWASVDANLAGELKTNVDSIRRYQQQVYYGGQWKPEYDRWVSMLAGLYAGPGKQRVAWNQALTTEMVFTQPVVYELPQLRVPTTLFIGQRDRTAIGRDRASPELRERLGDYPALGRRAAKAIAGAKLVEFGDLGHSPQVEAPARFEKALLEALNAKS